MTNRRISHRGFPFKSGGGRDSAAAPRYNLNPYSIIQRIILSGRILRLPVSGGLDLFQFEKPALFAAPAISLSSLVLTLGPLMTARCRYIPVPSK